MLKYLPVIIVFYWMVMMFLLFEDKIIPNWQAGQSVPIDPVDMTENWEDVRILERIMHNDRQLGSAALVIERLADDTFDVRHGLFFELRLIQNLELRWNSRLRLNERFELEDFCGKLDFTVKGLVPFVKQFDIVGFTTDDGGEKSDAGGLYFRLTQDGVSQYGKFDLTSKPSLMNSVGPTAFREIKPEVGNIHTIEVFDPMWNMNRGELRLRIADKEKLDFKLREGKVSIDTYRVESRFSSAYAGEFESVFWINEDGEVMRKEVMDEIVMERDIELMSSNRFTLARALRKVLEPEGEPLEIPKLRVAEFEEAVKVNNIVEFDTSSEAGVADLLKVYMRLSGRGDSDADNE